VLDPAMRILFEKQATLDVPANCYREAFALPSIPELPSVYFVRLDLADAAGQKVADNFYWLPAEKGGSMRALHQLPPVRLDRKCKFERHGRDMTARIQVSNPSDRLAFFVELAMTQYPGGPEILPVLWDDNYFSLLPGESREVAARFSLADAGLAKPTLEVGGWNVETDVDCQSLELAPGSIHPGQPISVNATVSKTFLDGSRVFAYWDGKPIASLVAFARGNKTQKLMFSVQADTAGRHQLRAGKKQIEVLVEP
jgi:hypothetical protein